MVDYTPSIHTDPFADPDPDPVPVAAAAAATAAAVVPERDLILESTLSVGRHASLTLGSDALIVFASIYMRHPAAGEYVVRLVHITSSTSLTRTTESKTTVSVPYYNILSAAVKDDDITIAYASPTSTSAKAPLQVRRYTYTITSPPELGAKWTARLLECAYGPAQRNKRIKVVVNPFGGVGHAPKKYKEWVAPIFEAAGCVTDVVHTTHQGHGIEIGEQLDIEQFDVIACASGDGMPMEAFNGLARKANAAQALRKIAVVQIPCGSGNAMSWNLTGTDECSHAALSIVKGVRTPLDLASVTQGTTRTLSFLSQCVGIVADCDLGTDNIRWMGDFRFTFGFLLRLMEKRVYPLDISVKTEIEHKTDIKAYYAREVAKRRHLDMRSHDILDTELETSTALGLPPLTFGTVSDALPGVEAGWSPLTPHLNLTNFYCGNMCWVSADTPFFPASLPNDGTLDLVTINGDMSRIKSLALMLDVSSGKFFDRDPVRYRKVTGVRVVPRFGWHGAEPVSDKVNAARHDGKGFLARLTRKLTGQISEEGGLFSVDGEKLPFEPFQIEVHRGLGTVLSRHVSMYEYEPNWHHEGGARTGGA